MVGLTRIVSTGVLVLTVAGVGFACQGSNLTLPSDRPSFNLIAVSGDGHEGTVGTELSLVVQVTDGAGQPVENISIRFEPKTAGAQVQSEEVPTNEQGQAETRVHLVAEGSQTVEARLAELESAVRTSFSLTAVAAPPPGEDDDDEGRDRGRGRGRGNGGGNGGDDDEEEDDD